MKEVNLFGVYIAPISVYLFAALIVFLLVRKIFDRVQIQKWVWHRPLFDTAVFIIILSVIGLLF